ncbi:MAG: hypothetical protein AAB685_02290, partial [Patescibacteria group bacterium]
AGALPRLLDMEVEPFLISSTTNLILAQRLVRRLCDEKEKYKLKASEVKDIAKYCDLDKILEILIEEKIIKPKTPWSDIVFYRPKRTTECPDG